MNLYIDGSITVIEIHLPANPERFLSPLAEGIQSRKGGSSVSTTVRWLTYDFTVYTPDTSWNEVAGVYIFTALDDQKRWIPLYVGQADSFRTRIPSHEQWNPAVQLGATHIHAMEVPLTANRDMVEQDLIQAYQPSLNVQS